MKREKSFFSEHPYLTVFVGLPTVFYGVARLISAARGKPFTLEPSGNDSLDVGDETTRHADGSITITDKNGKVKRQIPAPTPTAPPR